MANAARVFAIIIGAILFALFLAFIAGCDRTALQHASETFSMIHLAQEETVNIVTASLREDLRTECGAIQEPAAKLVCANSVGERYRDSEEGLAASAETIDALGFALLSWARAVAAKEADEERPPVAVCEALARLVGMVDAWVTFGGGTLPIEPWTCPEVSQ